MQVVAPILRAIARVSIAIATSVALLSPVTPASQVRPLNVEQMTERAARIFSGRCVATEIVVDTELGVAVTVATFEVDRVAKGDVGGTVALRMLGGDGVGTDDMAGMPRFRAGDEVVLFLYGESASGLSSPVGLGQGRFSVVTDKLGRKIALNDFANRNLLVDLTPAARERLAASSAIDVERKRIEPSALLDLAEALAAVAP